MEPFRQPVVDRTVLALAGRGAKLILNGNGDLDLRSRALVQRAIARRLSAPLPGPVRSLSERIHREGLRLRNTLLDRRPYSAYRMTW